MNRKLILISIISIIILNLLIYSKTIKYNFVNYDDPGYVTANPLIRELSSDNIKIMFKERYLYNYQPLVLLSYAVEHKHFKLNPSVYHATNLVLHIVNSILVMFLICIITKNGTLAFIIALFFSLHPLQVESVAWISERKGLMCAFFYFLSFIAYIRYSRDDKKYLFILSLILFFCSLLSKPMAVMFPAILLLFDYYEDKVDLKAFTSKIPFFVLTIIFSWITYSAQKSGGAVKTQIMGNLFQKVITAFYNFGFYISKFFVPARLSLHYGYPADFNYLSVNFIGGVFVAVALIIYAMNFKKISRPVNFGILFFMVSLIPVLRLVPIGSTHAADRYMYMPIIGLLFSVAHIIYPLMTKNVRIKHVMIVLLPVYLLIFTSVTVARIRIWENSLTMWTDTLEKAPENNNARFGIGEYYDDQKKNFNKAREYYLPLINNIRFREKVLYNTGVSYIKEKNYAESAKYISALIDEYPYNANAHMEMGTLHFMAGKFSDAASEYKRSIELDYNNHFRHFNYGLAMEKLKNFDEAIKHFSIAGSLQPGWEAPQNAIKRLSNAPAP